MGSPIGQGGMADVIALGDGTVMKAFRRQSHTHDPVRDWADHDALTRKLFEVEARAYECLLPLEDIQPFVPAYLGRLDPSKVPGLTPPTDTTYLPHCGIHLELIPGEDLKVSLLADPLKMEAEGILRAIDKAVGRLWVWDASCFVPGTRGPFTLIDFGFWQHYADAQIILAGQGHIPTGYRTIWHLQYDAA